MPNRQKQVLFCSAGLLSLCCALSAAVVTGLPYWLRGVVLCRTGAELVNATGAELDQFLGELSYGLFHGERVKQCGLGGRPSRFSFFPDLLGGIPVGLHVTIVFLCSVVVLFSSVASGFFFFNAFGRPYETLQGPMGLYLWTCVCCATSCLVLILFASEVKIHRLSELISNFREENFVFQTHSERYDRCFWIFFLILILHGLNLVLIRLTGIQFPFQGKKDVELSGGAADLMY
ncbi:PREDICTED: clarin-1 [Poecilia mexicana]|uniref:Clarin 1 n=1 Tax=Poecilia formosa TaxID=48698 RepID=A0A087XRS4_POEFO|nr:PREDICTED: clarin-1 [Poecilia formosa]XP_014836517.1 PREDICTED: clarin-1 [Poecilia mexicana]